jgi:serine/threonine protein kinase
MEYCELGDLNKYLRNSLLCPENRLPELDTREIVYQVLEALSTMHEENFCHRDLKLAVRFLVTTSNANTNILSSVEYPDQKNGSEVVGEGS